MSHKVALSAAPAVSGTGTEARPSTVVILLKVTLMR
jgi:hypothetical protein